MYIAVNGNQSSWNKPYPSLVLGVSVMHCTFVNTMLYQHFEVAWQMFFVAEDEKLRVKELEGSALSYIDPDGKELMHDHIWIALEAVS